MDLFLMRHADAMDGSPDTARLLSAKGRAQSGAMGRWLKKMDVEPSVIVTSPYPRAHETAYIVSQLLGPAKLVSDHRLTPGMEVETGCAIIYEFSKPDCTLLLVGHEPDLGRLTAYLIGACEECIGLRKGAVAQLKMMKPGFSGSALVRMVDPKAI